jgi:hypothetical protein
MFTSSTGLVSLNFLIDGQDFTLSDAFAGANVTFVDGVLTNIGYVGVLGGLKLVFGSVGLSYLYLDLSEPGRDTEGTISPSVLGAPGPTAGAGLPGLLLVLGGLLVWWRNGRTKRGSAALAA